jgi:hypothetical protein
MKHVVTSLAAVLCAASLQSAIAAPNSAVVDVATVMSRCSGLYAAAAHVADAERQSMTAEHFRGLRRGWQLSAQYLLARDALARGQRRVLGSFESFTQPIIETEAVRTLALIEREDVDGYQKAIQTCQREELVALQESIVQDMRLTWSE